MEKVDERKRFRKWRAVIAVLCISVVWASNSSYLARRTAGRPLLLAHRGVAQTFSLKGVTATTCTASRIDPPQNSFIENTIPSMRQAFADGAEAVELDIHATTDGQWAVFHDATLDCRTDGHGVTREHTLAYLKTLDIGYGYSADGGRTFPLRGKGVGMLPSLTEVLNTFPDRSLLLTIKSNNPADGAALAKTLSRVPGAQLRLLMVNGGSRPVAMLHRGLPAIRTSSAQREKHCILSYEALGWLGYMPHACRNSLLLVPANVGPWLWGWPDRFLARMDRAGTMVPLVNDLTWAKFKAGDVEGIDNATDMKKVPRSYPGWIWTDDIEKVGPLLKWRTEETENRK